MKKHIIWSNIGLNFADWEADLKEEYPERSESELVEIMYETNNNYLDDERYNLNIQMPSPILVIANLGLWNGNKSGYKEIKSGKISDCLYSDCDYAEWYVDENKDLRCKAIHHDGTNNYLYRVYKDGVSEAQIENLKEKIYNGTVTRKDITRITKRLGDEIAKVYGFEI